MNYLDFITAHWELVSGVAAAIGGALWRYVVQPFIAPRIARWWSRAARVDSALQELSQQHQKRTAQLQALCEQVGKLDAKVEDVRAQVYQNGGHSLRDVVDRLGDSMVTQDMLLSAVCVTKNIGVFMTSEDGRCTEANPAYLRMVGLSMEEARGNGWRDAIHPEDRADVLTQWTEAMDLCERFRASYRYLRPDGSVVQVQCRASPKVSPKTGALLGWLGTVVEVS
jgi:PAS domain S-box-containing protein